MIATILQQSKHGVCMDLADGDKRHHVRIFDYEKSFVPDLNTTVELPVTFNMKEGGELLKRIGEAMASGDWPQPDLGEPYKAELP